jgi:hypothetical protein
MVTSPPPLPNREQFEKKKRIAKIGIWLGAILCITPTLGVLLSMIQIVELISGNSKTVDGVSDGIASALFSTEIGYVLMVFGILILVSSFNLYTKMNKFESSQQSGPGNS